MVAMNQRDRTDQVRFEQALCAFVEMLDELSEEEQRELSLEIREAVRQREEHGRTVARSIRPQVAQIMLQVSGLGSSLEGILDQADQYEATAVRNQEQDLQPA